MSQQDNSGRKNGERSLRLCVAWLLVLSVACVLAPPGPYVFWRRVTLLGAQFGVALSCVSRRVAAAVAGGVLAAVCAIAHIFLWPWEFFPISW